MFLTKILAVLTIVLSLSGLTFAAELKIKTGVPGWVQRSKPETDLNTRKKATAAANQELSRRAKAAGHGQTGVPGWVQRSKPETDPVIRKQGEPSRRVKAAGHGQTGVPGWVRRPVPEIDPDISKEFLVSEIKRELVDHAKTYLGSPYKYGGNGFSGIDCSGFVKNVYDKFGVRLPRTARQQYMMGTSIDRGELSMGDLIFFRQGHGGDPSHVGIFLEDGKFIHSSARRKGGVRVDSLDDNLYRHTFMGGRKLVD